MYYDIEYIDFNIFIVEIDVSKNKEMMDYNTVVIVNDFRKEMFWCSIGIYTSI